MNYIKALDISEEIIDTEVEELKNDARAVSVERL